MNQQAANTKMNHLIFLEDRGLLSTLSLDRIKSNLGLCLDFIAATESAGGPFELSVSFTDNNEIKAINKEFRGKDKATDVLSFSQLEGEPVPSADTTIPMGDLVVSVETAQRQADQIGHSLEYELNRLLVHGLYHLLGYDHEQSDDEKKMQSKEDALLDYLEKNGQIP